MVIHCIVRPLVFGRKYFSLSCGIELVVSFAVDVTAVGSGDLGHKLKLNTQTFTTTLQFWDLALIKIYSNF